MSDYNGWTNYETWNCALWIDNCPNTEALLTGTVIGCADGDMEIHDAVDVLLELLPERTGDGVPYTFRRVHEAFMSRLSDELYWRKERGL